VAKTQILVVDDEQDLVNLVRYNLQKEGYDVLCAYEGASVVDLVWSRKPALIILDLMLPDRSGVDICREIKSNPQIKAIPIIMLTARSSEEDRVRGFEAGAEDYVVKPFSPKELTLRVKAMLARTLPPSPDVLQVGPLTIWPNEYRVSVKPLSIMGNGTTALASKPATEEVHLTQSEFQLLLLLAKHPNVVKTREQLLAELWQDEAEVVLDRAVDAQIKRLRAKLGSARDTIETVRGVGYRMVP